MEVISEKQNGEAYRMLQSGHKWQDMTGCNRITALGVAFHEHFKGIVPVSLVTGRVDFILYELEL